MVEKGKIDEAYFQKVADETAGERRIPFGGPIPHEVIDAARAREKMAKMVERDLAPGELYAQSRAREAIGFGAAPAGAQRDEVAALAAEQAAGFYDPVEKRFYILDREMPGLTGALVGFASWLHKRDLAGELVVSHELVHALQDARYDLREFAKVPANDDAELARDAVVEGDATRVSFRALWLGIDDSKITREDLLDAPGEAFARATPLAREELIFPYYGGVGFLHAIERAKPPRDPWREPPRSTAEVLHPEKYLARTAPKNPAFADAAPPAGWRLLRENTVGELGLLVLFEGEKETREGAKALAAGWAGDRYRVYEREKTGDLALAWSLVFESGEAARSFVTAYRRFAALRKKLGPASIATLTGEKTALVVEAPEGPALFAIGLPALLAR
jgi:hypothetical protein